MIEVEHLVYGSFSFDGSAQHIPAQSKGITKKIRTEITSFCDSWGECKNLKFLSSLNQVWLKDEPDSEPKIAVIKIIHHGRDFSGRSGALLRHALIFKHKDYESFGFNPFTVEDLNIFKSDWNTKDSCETLFIEPAEIPEKNLSLIPGELYPSLKENLSFFLKGFSLLSYRIINTPSSDAYLRYLFYLLPYIMRKKLSLTTFAFRKNFDYQIGCIYSSARIPKDDLFLEFEKKKVNSSLSWQDDLINEYLGNIFSLLGDNRFSQAENYLKDYPVRVNI
jgi:hypothetical protein